MGVRCTVTTWPCPPQVEQVEAVVPAFTPLPVHTPHSSNLLTLMSFLQINSKPAQVELNDMLSNGLGCNTDVWY
jgi:ABC-type microcin C transport system permease subunit YejE